MSKEKPKEPSWEDKLRYDRSDTIEKHLDKQMLYSTREAQEAVQIANTMHTDAIYESAKAGLRGIKELGGSIAHANFPKEVTIKHLSGELKEKAAHDIIEKIVEYGLKESYREHGKNLDEKKATAHVRSHIGGKDGEKKISSDPEAISRHLKAYTGGRVDYHSLMQMLSESDNILSDLKNQREELGGFMTAYTQNLNKLLTHHTERQKHIERVYATNLDMKKSIDKYTDLKAAEANKEIKPGTGLAKRLNWLSRLANAKPTADRGDAEVVEKPKKR